MVEPVSATMGVPGAGLLAKPAGKAAEKAGERPGDAGVGVLQRFARWLRRRVAGRQEVASAVADVEKVPGSSSLVRALGATLDRYAQQEPGFASQLDEQVKQVQGAGVQAITQTALGNQN